jgi:hypothetical protein
VARGMSSKSTLIVHTDETPRLHTTIVIGVQLISSTLVRQGVLSRTRPRIKFCPNSTLYFPWNRADEVNYAWVMMRWTSGRVAFVLALNTRQYRGATTFFFATKQSCPMSSLFQVRMVHERERHGSRRGFESCASVGACSGPVCKGRGYSFMRIVWAGYATAKRCRGVRGWFWAIGDASVVSSCHSQTSPSLLRFAVLLCKLPARHRT